MGDCPRFIEEQEFVVSVQPCNCNTDLAHTTHTINRLPVFTGKPAHIEQPQCKAATSLIVVPVAMTDSSLTEQYAHKKSGRESRILSWWMRTWLHKTRQTGFMC